jgi:hypothetical protein
VRASGLEPTRWPGIEKRSEAALVETMTRKVLLVAFVVVTLVLVFFGSNSIAAGMTSGGMMGGEGMDDMPSRIVPNVLVLGVAVMLGWALFGKRH